MTRCNTWYITHVLHSDQLLGLGARMCQFSGINIWRAKQSQRDVGPGDDQLGELQGVAELDSVTWPPATRLHFLDGHLAIVVLSK